MENWTNLEKGREGVKNPGNFADIICTWPHTDCIPWHHACSRAHNSHERSVTSTTIRQHSVRDPAGSAGG